MYLKIMENILLSNMVIINQLLIVLIEYTIVYSLGIIMYRKNKLSLKYSSNIMIIIFEIQLSYSIQKRITGDRLPSKQRNVEKLLNGKLVG